MAQVTIYGLRRTLAPLRTKLSEAIHTSVIAAFEYPPEKRFHRFLLLDEVDFIHPSDRSDHYTIIELNIFEGRSVDARKHLIRQLYERIPQGTGITRQDIEITIFETPRYNWGIRGLPGDEIGLNYKVEV